MAYAIIVFVIACAIIVARVYFNMRRLKQATSSESWDEKVIAGLRSKGYAPFNAYPVDFFLALPDAAACQSARSRLEPEFSVDTKPMQEESGFSLHATKTMRLIVPQMQEISRRLTALAEELGGRYDGWAA